VVASCADNPIRLPSAEETTFTVSFSFGLYLDEAIAEVFKPSLLAPKTVLYLPLSITIATLAVLYFRLEHFRGSRTGSIARKCRPIVAYEHGYTGRIELLCAAYYKIFAELILMGITRVKNILLK